MMVEEADMVVVLKWFSDRKCKKWRVMDHVHTERFSLI